LICDSKRRAYQQEKRRKDISAACYLIAAWIHLDIHHTGKQFNFQSDYQELDYQECGGRGWVSGKITAFIANGGFEERGNFWEKSFIGFISRAGFLNRIDFFAKFFR